jgi:hypothetical protein
MTEPSNPPEQPLTIPEAAQRLAISERHLRRLLARPEYTDKTQTLIRTTRTGTRTSAGVPQELLEALQMMVLHPVESDNDGQAPGKANTGSKHGQEGQEYRQNVDNADIRGASTKEMPVFVSELIAEKDRRIADLAAALEHEREAHRRAETLHLGTMGELAELRRRASELEAVNLKLIEALPPAQDMPPEARQSAETNETVSTGVSAGAEAQEAKVAGFWEVVRSRFFGWKE